MKTIQTNQAPQALGPYVQAKVVNGFLYASGQISLDPQTGQIVGTTIQEQTEQVLKNVGAILRESKSDFDHVVKTTCFLKNMSDFGPFNEVYETFFSNEAPSRSTVEVSCLPKNALVEIEVIALVNHMEQAV